MVKEFQITYLGKKEPLVIEDSPKAGVILPIIKRAMKTKVGQTQPEIDVDEWTMGIFCNMIIKAPWGRCDPEAFKNLDYKTTLVELTNILGEHYALVDFLSPGLKMLYGKRLDGVESASPTTSTTSLPSGESPSGQ